MSCQRSAVLWASLAVAIVCVGGLVVPCVLGQGDTSAKSSVADALGLALETKDFAEPMPLKHFLVLIQERCAEKGIHLPILVDTASFREADDAQPDGPNDDEIKLPAVPKTLTVGKMLQIGISQIKTKNGAFIVRNGSVVIMTRTSAGLAARLREPVLARFEKTPLTEVIQGLSRMTGASIVLDPRLKEATQTPITADFRGDVPLEAALRIVADMAEARIVLVIDGGIYVTTPTNAEAMEKRLRARKLELEKEKEAALP